jgi:predicted small lipoprotein YifL
MSGAGQRGALIALALALAGCGGSEPLALPSDPVDRAATCGVVAAAGARVAVNDMNADLPLEAQGRILHYGMLAASEGGEFKAQTASDVSHRMAALQDKITQGKWQALPPSCAAAFPATTKPAAALPAAPLDAQLACEELAGFLDSAIPDEKGYGNELAEYRRLRRELNDALAPRLRARAGSQMPAQQAARRKALAAAAQLGPPIPVMQACLKRFG